MCTLGRLSDRLDNTDIDVHVSQCGPCGGDCVPATDVYSDKSSASWAIHKLLQLQHCLDNKSGTASFPG